MDRLLGMCKARLVVQLVSCDLSHHELLARQLVLANICSGTWSWQLIIAIYPISYCPLAVVVTLGTMDVDG